MLFVASMLNSCLRDRPVLSTIFGAIAGCTLFLSCLSYLSFGIFKFDMDFSNVYTSLLFNLKRMLILIFRVYFFYVLGRFSMTLQIY